ncbi:MAG: PAS domain S-box protein [Candidatus Micrarchaeota archaeon]
MPEKPDVSKLVEKDPLFFFENTLDPKALLDFDGRFLLVNKRLEEVTGYSKKELVGKKFFESGLLTLKSRAVCIEKFLMHMAGTASPPFEIEAMTKAGDKLHYELNATEIRMEGKIAGLYVGFRDLTERRKFEKELKNDNEKLGELLMTLTRDLKLEIVSLKASLLDLEQCKGVSQTPQFKKAVLEAEEINGTLARMREKLSR